MSRYPLRESLPVGKPVGEVQDWYTRQSAFDQLDRMAQRVIQPGGTIASENGRQSVLLLSGDHNGFEAECDVWRVSGAPGAVIRNRVLVTSGVVIFNQVSFRVSNGQQNNGACVEIGATGRAVFNNCHFWRDVSFAGSIATVANGGKAVFNGCVMEPANTYDTFAVNNAGGVLNVYVQGNINLTGALHNNVTIISELT